MEHVKIFPHLPGGGTRHRNMSKYKRKPVNKSAFFCEFCEHWHLVKHQKPVYQFDFNNNFIEVHESLNAAADKTNIPRKNIRECAKGNRKSAGNYIWRFKNDECSLSEIEPGKKFLIETETWIRIKNPPKNNEFLSVNIHTGVMVSFNENKEVIPFDYQTGGGVNVSIKKKSKKTQKLVKV